MIGVMVMAGFGLLFVLALALYCLFCGAIILFTVSAGIGGKEGVIFGIASLLLSVFLFWLFADAGLYLIAEVSQ